MLRSDVNELDKLISDDLLFVGPGGEMLRKQDDLNVHRLGIQKLDQADWLEVLVRMHGNTAVSVVTAFLSGSFGDKAFSGRFRYCRFWSLSQDGWKIIGGSVAPISST